MFRQRIKAVLKALKKSADYKITLLFGSGLLIISGWGSSLMGGPLVLFDTLMIFSTSLAGFEIARLALQGLKNRNTNIELLVTVATIGGLAIGVYWEAAAVTFLFLLGGWLEARTMRKTRSTLRELINMVPDTALVLKGKDRKKIPAREVEKGMRVLVKPGAKIPVDGTVESGRTTVDESMITGESIPAEKQVNSEVYAGTINQNGHIQVLALQSGADTTLAKIIRRVEEAQEEQAPTQRFIERFAQWYTPTIVGLSIASYLFTMDLELSLTLLVIGCPGALVISTPISVISGIGRAARQGILIKGGEHLENAGKITAVALDKTGTLTEGKPRVTDLVVLKKLNMPAGEIQENQPPEGLSHINLQEKEANQLNGEFRDFLHWAAIAESVSEHPLAQAIMAKAKQSGAISEPDSFESHTGLGVEAIYQTHKIIVGNRDLMRKSGIEITRAFDEKVTRLAKKGRTIVFVARDLQLIGMIGIADRIRPEAPQMIKQLYKQGIKEIVMLTGDRKSTAKSIADKLGIEAYHAGILPKHKNDYIQELQENYRQVAMLGDGINDAPALARADVGIAMGAAGTDVAIETADIALMTDDLMNVPKALRISQKTLRNIRQNVAVALLAVGGLLAGVFMGAVHMAAGMLIHELSVMLVILNGIRLRWA
ncbi:MAG TPA: cation-translocating P-type ATPase [Balneolaceae bacterium]|nr:cation-translocating P-type ATPase [Balneolaceae bacterium]